MISAAEAAAAYKAKAAGVMKDVANGPGIGAEVAPSGGSSFVDLVKGAVSNSVSANHQAENIAQLGVGGQADLTDVVTAVTNAEMTLQTVINVRDRVIRSYQEILKMPI